MDREEAVRQFVAQSELEEQLGALLSAIVGQNPRAILLFWETDKGFAWTTAPIYSEALAEGLVLRASALIVGEENDDDDDSDDS